MRRHVRQMRSLFSTPKLASQAPPPLATQFFSSSSLSRRSLLHGHGGSSCQLGRLQDRADIIPIKKFNRAFCTAAQGDLTAKKCVPCSSKDLQPMSEQTAQLLLHKVEGWRVANEDATLKLHRSWTVKSFTKGLEFFQLVADVAEAEGHHPDLHLVGWNKVKIDIWTHSVGGLTENDFILAAKINLLEPKFAGLLRRKASN